MSYLIHFQHADDIVAHLDTVVPNINDPLLKAKYVGFVAIAAVTVYEVAIKNIFVDFARGKHKILGNFAEIHFKQINGRIKISNIKDDYIKRFGQKYLDKFDRRLSKCAADHLIATHRDIKSSYANLIVWRNDFAHEGRIHSMSTYEETVRAYQDGKEVIRCLAEAMVR